MLQQYEEMRREILDYIDINRDYEKVIILTKEYLKIIKKYDKNYVQDDYWFAFYILGLVNKKVGNLRKAIKYAKLSNRYYVEDAQYIKTIWLLAVCYEQILPEDKNSKKQMIRKISRIYGRCSAYYRIIDMKERRIMILFNIAKLKSNTKQMYSLIKFLILRLLGEDPMSITYKMNFNLLQDMCKELIDAYIINDEDSTNIFRLLKTVPFASMRKELFNYNAIRCL